MSSVRERLEGITEGVPVFPLVVLFGLNAVDELDRTAFGVLSPEIRDAFHLSNQGILGFVTAFVVSSPQSSCRSSVFAIKASLGKCR